MRFLVPSDRYFIDEPLQKDKEYQLKGEEFHHLIRVMRGRVGETIELVNGNGEYAEAIIKKIEKHSCTLEAITYQAERKPTRQIILAQAIPKMNRLEYILEKGTELGLTQFWLFPSENGEKREFSPSQINRMHTIVISALKQSGRLYLPSILFKPTLKMWTSIELPAFFGDISSEAISLKAALEKLDQSTSLTFFIGPESGFSEAEILHLRHKGIVGVTLSRNILRTDTAAITAAAIVSATFIS